MNTPVLSYVVFFPLITSQCPLESGSLYCRLSDHILKRQQEIVLLFPLTYEMLTLTNQVIHQVKQTLLPQLKPRHSRKLYKLDFVSYSEAGTIIFII